MEIENQPRGGIQTSEAGCDSGQTAQQSTTSAPNFQRARAFSAEAGNRELVRGRLRLAGAAALDEMHDGAIHPNLQADFLTAGL